MRASSTVIWFICCIGVINCFIPTPWLKFLSNSLGSSLGTQTHWKITENAILRVAEETLIEYKIIGGPVSSLSANELVRAAYGKSASARDFKLAIREIQKANSMVDKELPKVSAAHFDSENFAGGSERLANLRSSVLSEIRNEKYDAARVSAGQFLHTLQDFYSHSNWIELGRSHSYETLVTGGHIQESEVAPPLTPTCNGISSLINTSPKVLTSGYYDNERPKPSAWKLKPRGITKGKCSHGGILDSTTSSRAFGGINKDSTNSAFSPHFYLHSVAARVAEDATAAFLNEIRRLVGNYQCLRFLNLIYGSSLCFVIDTTGSMGNDIAQVRIYVNSIIDSYLASGQTPTNYVLVPFNDPHYGPETDTTDPVIFKQFIAALSVNGGGDLPELAFSGLILALEKCKERSNIYLFTDAPPKDCNRFPEAVTLIKNKRSTVWVIYTGSSNIQHYCSEHIVKGRRRRATSDSDSIFDVITRESGGQVLSGSKSDVGSLLRVTSSFTAASDVTLVSDSYSQPATNDRTAVAIDATISELTVTVSGSNPSISIVDPSGQTVLGTGVAVNISDSVKLPRTAVARVSNPMSGQWIVQVSTTSSYALTIKSLSPLDFVYSLVVPEETNHPGMFEILGNPRVGRQVCVLMTVVGLPLGYSVDRAVFQAENGTVLEDAKLQELNETDDQYITDSDVTIPSQSFHIGLRGKSDTGLTFYRLEPVIVSPVPFQVTVLPESDLSLRQGAASNVSFLVANAVNGARDTLLFTATDDLNLARRVVPSTFDLDANGTQSVQVEFVVPGCFHSGTTDTLTVIVKSTTTNEFNSFIMRIHVSSELADINPPVCALTTSSTCTTPTTCDSTWSATWTVIDIGSGIQEVEAQSNKTTLSFSPSLETTSANSWITVTASVPCCVSNTTISVTDRAGNRAHCSASSVFTSFHCSQPCQNGGRCVGNNLCFCPGGVYGRQCEKVGCSSPATPAQGYIVKTTGTHQIGDVVEFACDEGYDLSGMSKRTCCAFGWTGSTPACLSPDGVTEEIVEESLVSRPCSNEVDKAFSP